MHPISLLKATVLLIFILLFVSISAFSQAPNLLNYQGVARNTVGNPLPNQTMKLRLSVHDLLPSGAVVYSEIRQITTNLGGLFSVQIGSAGASSSTGTIAGVNWIVGNKFLQVELDPASNNNYLDIGTVQLVSVPYAFGAGTAATVKTNANLTGVVTSVGNATFIANGAITTDMIGTLNKSKVGLDLVNNTSDAAKPISTSTQGALDLKASAADVTTALGRKLAIADSTNGYVTPTQLAAKTFDTTSLSDRINLKANTSSLATVATSGSYNDLTNKPAVPAEYSLPSASASSLGGIKVGNNLSIDGDGVLSGASSYSLPTASASSLGGIKVGAGLTITNDVLSASASGIPYTGATKAVDLGAFDLMVNGITVGRGKNGLDNNVGIGKNVLSNTTSGFQGNYLTAVGYEALKTNTWGYFNTAFGSSSLFSNTTGLANTSIGSNSLLNNTTANFNTAVGPSALRNNTTGENNTASGASSLVNNTTGEQNSAFGRNALESNTTGSINTATGVGALSSNTAGGANTANGASALTSNIAGGGNTAMGNNALRNTNSSENTAIGNNAGVLNTTGTNNTAIGGYANFGANNLTNATALGYEATVSASNTIQLGNTSVTNVNTSGTITAGEVTYPKIDGAVGTVLTANANGIPTWTAAAGGIPYTGATSAVDLGAYDLKVNGLTIGKGAGNVSDNTAIGNSALFDNTNGASNTATGSFALRNNTIGSYNTANGKFALYKNTGGSNNTANGLGALFANTTGNYNTAIGTNALAYNSVGQFNTANGESALFANTTGDYNTANGLYALRSNMTGSENTAIGFDADVASDNLTNTTVIGNGARVTASNTIQLGNTSITDVKTSGTLTAGAITYPKVDGTAGQVLTTNGTGTPTWTTPSGGGVSSIGAISGSSTANGGSITAGVLNLAPADATNGGIVTTGNQAFSGGKVFNDNIQVNSVRIGAPGSAGSANTMLGAYSFQYGSPGGNNTGVGTMSLASITNSNNGGSPGGNDNTAVGSNAIRQGQGASNGNRNTAVGSTALTNASDASDNTALGYATLPIATGGANTAVGSNSLAAITSGTNNTAIGYGATVSSGTQTNSTAIGNGAIASASNLIQLGNTSVTDVKTSGTITAGAITYPSIHGTSGQVLSTTGSGTLTWTTASGGGSQWTSSSNDIYYSTGNVGIGTNSPSSKLHLVGAGASGERNNMLRIESNNNASLTLKNTNANAGGGEYQLFTSSSNSNPSLGAGSLAIYYDHPSAAAYRFSINTAGNVGIGTGMPTEKLDVLGNVKTSGTITAAGLEVTGNVTSTAGSISGFDAALNNQTGTTYTLTSSDNGKVVTLNNASPITLTINTGLGDGFNCLIVQKGAGQITMAGTATRINRQSHTKTAGQYAVVSIVNIGSETIIVAGDTGS